MKYTVAIAFLATLILFGVYWYKSGATMCPAPITYRLGNIDQNFSLSPELARQHLASAEEIWESVFDRDLFVYDESSKFAVNFIFDDRQANADAETVTRQKLDKKQAENEALFKTIESIQSEYERMVAQLDARRVAYETALLAYNKEVKTYNDRGGAPASEFARLEREKESLEVSATELKKMDNELSSMADRLNQLGERANREIALYNETINKYNKKYGHGEEFTQGDYQGDSINIYKFSSDSELITVLAHEFGHALGIGHVAGEDSLMYYLLKDKEERLRLSESDQEAFYQVCGKSETLSQKLRRMVRESIEKF